jgi:replication factor C subunit 2/4
MNIPWIEKYRPIILEDIILDKNIMSEITNIIKNKDIPNMILTGTPGVGKTTTLLYIAHRLYGNYMNYGVLELNASDDRGIKSINTDVYNFCNFMLSYRKEDETKYCKHKLIIFDEADNMTDKALPIISNLMDTYQDTTRFVFTCNTSSKIIESIQSRCKILRFMRIEKPLLIKRLKVICENEKIEYKKNGLEEIANISGGDVRNAINLLELTYTRFNKITDNNVYNACDIPKPQILKEILVDGLNKKLKECIIKIQKLKEEGYTVNDIIYNMIHILKSTITDDIKELDKMKIMELCSKYIYRMSRTKETDIQLFGFIVELNKS